VTRREFERERKLPADLVARLAQATSLGQAVWERAREASDFAMFRPQLERIVDLTIAKAEALGHEGRIYDALLDEYEPGMRAAEVERLFGEMKAGLVPLVEAISERQDAVDDAVLAQAYDERAQWAFGLDVVKRIGFDFERGRQDRSAHPFTTSFTPSDVRLTTRLNANQLKMGLFGSIHEAGHGMYEQGLDRALDRTPLSDGASGGMHESQSRMWENVVGRSRAFWTFWLPHLKEYFPGQLQGVDVERFYRAINRVRPSFIRVEADEVTYNLHIFLRFEIEELLLGGKVQVADLPELWDARMEAYLGIRPPDAARGVLQDIHWSGGMFGYFPSYSLGNLVAAQLYRQAVDERPGIPDEIRSGEFGSLLGWMQKKVHIEGAKYTPSELVQRITGGPIRTGPFLDYMQGKYTEIYGL
jgi:carboxypeptidase Taq